MRRHLVRTVTRLGATIREACKLGSHLPRLQWTWPWPKDSCFLGMLSCLDAPDFSDQRPNASSEGGRLIDPVRSSTEWQERLGASEIAEILS